MCGIVGIWELGNRGRATVSERDLTIFTDSLKHRGPDGRGIYIDKNANLGLGHRRLSIFDLSDSGKQPMAYANNRYWITYNGEVYNFIEIRKELEGLGCHFKTNTDTEVIIAAYHKWGQKCLYKFNGMWAFAIFDSKKRKLFLSRDRFGVKPLFYLYNGNTFIFASELKAFMALNNKIQPKIDKSIIAMMTNNDSCKKTILQNVYNLNAGHCLSISTDGVIHKYKWWSTLEHLVKTPKDFDSQVEQYKELFFDACRVRMRSDVQIGTALSGGIDSSSVLCTISNIQDNEHNLDRASNNRAKSFVFDYVDTTHSERKYAEKIINHTGAVPFYKEMNSLQIKPDDLINSIFHLEAIQNREPYIGPFMIYKEMRDNGVFVSIDGHGADESITGYHDYIQYGLKDNIWPWNKAKWDDLQLINNSLYSQDLEHEVVIQHLSRLDVGNLLLSPLKYNLRRLGMNLLHSNSNAYNFVRKIYRKKRGGAPKNPEEWLLIKPGDVISSKPEIFTSKYSDHVNRKLYYDFHYGCLTKILRNFDRQSMAHGVEVRSPFLDHRLVSYSFSLPSIAKQGGGYTKRILRESMKNILPENIRTRTSKIGFSSPIEEWYNSPLKEFIVDSINSKEFIESDIWNGPLIKDYLDKEYKRKNYKNASNTWKYIQAMLLIRSFDSFSKSLK